MTARIYIKGNGALAGGVVSIENGSVSFIGIGTMFGGADLEGARLTVYPVGQEPIFVGTVAEIDPRFPVGQYPHLGPIELTFPWEGATITEQPFLLELSAVAVPASLATNLFGRFVSFFERAGAMFFDGRDTPAADITPFLTRALWYDPIARLLKGWSGGQFRSIDVVGAPWNAQGPWDRRPTEKTALTILSSPSGVVPIDASAGAVDDEGVRHFSLIVDENVELQAPTSVAAGTRLFLRVAIDGGPHDIAFADVFTLNPGFTIEPNNDAVSLVFMEVVSEDGGIATEVLVSRFAYAKNDLVARGGQVYVSNVDVNIVDPAAEDATGLSNKWTKQPAVTGDRGEQGRSGFSYEFDDSTAMDSDPDPGDVRTDTGDLALVTEINLARVDRDGINRQDQFQSYVAGDRIEIKVRSGAAVFGAFRITAPAAVTSERVVFAVELIDKQSQLTDGESLDIVFLERGPEGVAGTDPGGLYTWDEGNGGDPGSGEIQSDNDNLAAATTLYVHKTNRSGNDLAAWLGSFGGSTNAIKGVVTLTRSGGNAQATFDLTGISVEADWVELAVENHAGATGFMDEDAVSLQFSRTGDDGVVVGDVSSVNGQTGNVVLRAGHIQTDPDGTFDGDDVETVLDDLDGRINDADADIAGKVDKATYDAHSILAAVTDNTPAVVTVAEQRIVGRVTGGNIDDLTGAQVRSITGQALDNLAATTNPAATDDGPDGGYSAGSIWVNVTLDRIFLCVDATNDAAIWRELAIEHLIVECSDETTTLTTGAAKKTFFMPYRLKLIRIPRARLKTAQTGGSLFTVDINEAGSTIMSATKLTFDNNEDDTDTAATPAVLSDDDLAAGAKMTVDIDQVGSGTPRGLVIELTGYKL